MFGVILNNNGVVLATCIAVVVRRGLCSWTPSFFRIRNSLLCPSYSLEQSISLLSVLAILADALQLPKLASLRLFVTIATPIHPRASLCYYYNYTGALFCSTTTYYTGGGRMEKKRNWVVVEEEDEASFFFNSYLNPRTFCVAGRTPTRSGADVTPSPAAAATAAGAAH